MTRSLTLALLLAVAVAVATPATAQISGRSKRQSTEEMGTPEQRAACRPDVRRFCRSIKPEEGAFAYVNCLQEHREKLRPACVRVLDGGVP